MKSNRQNAIREIIAAQCIRTQEELANALNARGFTVTQATVSRDIKDMQLVKVPSEDGGYRYATSDRSEMGISDRLSRILSDSVVDMDSAGNLIVVRTLSGSAHVAGEAIDTLKWPEIVGTIAGDNTILVIVRTEGDVQNVIGHFREILG